MKEALRQMDKTLEYYDENAQSYYNNTINLDMGTTMNRFLAYLKEGDTILDLGCGSGRDSKVFIDKGFNVVSVDGSRKMCELAEKYIGQKVLCRTFEEIIWKDTFNGIWACASLLHVPDIKMKTVIQNLKDSLKIGGVLYCSFKLGYEEREEGKRTFNDYDMHSLLSTLSINGFEVLEIFVTDDIRENRKGEQWINAIARKYK